MYLFFPAEGKSITGGNTINNVERRVRPAGTGGERSKRMEGKEAL